MMVSGAPVYLADVIRAMSPIWNLDYSDDLAAFDEALKEYNGQQS